MDASSEEIEPLSSGRKQLPKNNREYGKKEYWDHRFAEESEFEWLVSYADVQDQIEDRFLKQQLKQDNPLRILLVGCGNSNFTADLYDAGFSNNNLVSIDYSEIVIENMKQKNDESRPHMQWLVMDMTDLTEFEDNSFDVVVDKAAMDALMTQEGDVWNPNQSVIDQSRKMCEHISRILKPGGYHLHISFAQPHFRKKYLLGWHPKSEDEPEEDLAKRKGSDDSYSEEFGWTFDVENIGGQDKSDGCWYHFLYIMQTKTRSS